MYSRRRASGSLARCPIPASTTDRIAAAHIGLPLLAEERPRELRWPVSVDDGIQQHQRVGAVVEGEPLRDAAAEPLPDRGDTLDIQEVEELAHVSGLRRQIQRCVTGLIRVARCRADRGR